MEGTNSEVLLKSQKKSQKKKILIAWAVAALFLIASIVSFIVDYSGYKKGQEFGLASAIVASGISGSSWVNKNDSYAEQCKAVYDKLSHVSYDFTLYGQKYDRSEIRKTEEALRSSFAKVMEAGGYDRYSSYNIADWFKYTNPIEYFTGYYWHKILNAICLVVIVLAAVFTVLVSREAKKELVVYEDSVLCKANSKKSKQLLFEDINNVDFGKNSIRLVGTGVNYKISNITNAEEIKSLIIEKKKSTQGQAGVSNVNNQASNADELKKYKDLLDNGVISQEEFETKKKQLLGS